MKENTKLRSLEESFRSDPALCQCIFKMNFKPRGVQGKHRLNAIIKVLNFHMAIYGDIKRWDSQKKSLTLAP